MGTVNDLAVRFGFSLSDLEVVVAAAPDRIEPISAALAGVPGILGVAHDGSADGETAWVLTTDPQRDVHETTRDVVAALGDAPLVRVGQRRVALESIYRRAVEEPTTDRRLTA